MNKKNLLIILIVIAIIAAGFFVFWKYGMSQKNEIVYYYGDGCPHCANVEQFVKDNRIDEKVSYVKKEVFNNQENSKELISVAQKCGLPADQVGVPLLWDSANSKCYVGDTDIIDFLKYKAEARI